MIFDKGEPAGLRRLVVARTAVFAAIVSLGAMAAMLAGQPASASAARPVISTVAGGVGGPGPASEIPSGGCVVTYAGGSLYAQSSLGAIRKISLRTGHLTTVAGTGVQGPVADGQSWAATNLEPSSCGIAIDAHGNMVFSDGEHIGPQGGLRGGNNLVRVLAAKTGKFYGRRMMAGRAYTIAGDDSYGFSGDGGPANSAQLADPAGLAVDQAGNVVVADAGNDRIRVIAEKSGVFYGLAMTAGAIYTVAGGGTSGLGDGGPATSAELSIGPRRSRAFIATDPGAVVRVDHHGNIVIADQSHSRIRVVAGSTGRYYGVAMKAGFIYTVAGGGTRLLRDGGPATKALLRYPSAIAIDHAGNIVIADQYDQRIRVAAVVSGRFYGQVMKAGDIYTVAGNGGTGFSGDGGPARKAGLSYPAGVSVDGSGSIVISGSCAAPVSSSSETGIRQDCLRVVAARAGRFYGMTMKRGDIYAISGVDGAHFGDGGPALHAEFDADPLSFTAGFATDPAGDMAIGDSGDGRIRLVPITSGTRFGQAMTGGDIYTIAGDGKFGDAGNGGSAIRAELGLPGGLAFDRHGNLLISDPGNYTVRVVAARSGTFYGKAMTAGHIYPIAGTGRRGKTGNGGPATSAKLRLPEGIAVDANGNLVIADNGPVQVVAASTGRFYGQAMTAGHIYQIATISGAQVVAIDTAGNLIVSGYGRTFLIAQVSGTYYGKAMTAGHNYLIAGGTADVGPDPGNAVPATSTNVYPDGVALDLAGNLLLSDRAFQIVRVVARTSGTFYGKPMVAGDVYTIAGHGTAGLDDKGLAIRASFACVSVSVLPSGAIDVDTQSRIRQIRT